jgi:hypothetical protein
MRLHRLSFLLFAAAVSRGTALEWKTREVSVTTAPFQVVQEVSFPFRNPGPRPVKLLSLRTDCDCLEAAADRSSYPPGREGMVVARFTVGDRFGLYERTVTVVTDESPVPVRLTARIEVPAPAVFTPRRLTWLPGAPRADQVGDLQVASGLTIDFTDAQSTNPAFGVRLETVLPGRRYRVRITPPDTARPASAAIRVFGRDPSGRPVVVSTYAEIAAP